MPTRQHVALNLPSPTSLSGMNSRIASATAPALGPGRPCDDPPTDVAVAAPGLEAGADAYPDSTCTMSALARTSVMNSIKVKVTAPTLSIWEPAAAHLLMLHRLSYATCKNQNMASTQPVVKR